MLESVALRKAGTEGSSRTSPSTTGLRRWLALTVLLFGTLLISVEVTVLSLAMPMITEQLRPSATEALWIGDAYAFTLAASLVAMGLLGDRIGRKKLLLFGAGVFGLLSIPSAFAPNPIVLILARALLGVAAATLMPSTLSLIRNIFTEQRQRTFAIGLWSMMLSAGGAIGPLLGGLLLSHFWWGSVFLIKVPLVLLLVIAGAFLLPESRDPNPAPWDMFGVALSMLGMFGVVYAIKELTTYGPGELAAWIAGIVGIGALWWFVRRQRRSQSPMLDVRLFANARFSGATGANVIAALADIGVLFFLTQYLELVLGLSALEAGVRLLPAAGSAVPAALLAGRLARRGSPRIVVVGGLGLSGVSMLGLMTVTADTPYVLLAVFLAALGWGLGFAMTVTTDEIVASAPKEKAGAAGAISETAFELGGALGIALLGTVLTAVYRARLEVPRGADAETVRDSLGGAVSEAHRLGDGGLLSLARDAFVHGQSVAYASGGVLLLLCAGACWFLLRRPADTP